MKKYNDHTYADCPEPGRHHKAGHRIINSCDHGHMTGEPVKLLPVGGSGNVIVCRRHYEAEMEFRRERINAGAVFHLPAWDSLKNYGDQQEVPR